MTDRAASSGSNHVMNAVREAVMASATGIASFEHAYDPDAERYVLSIDVVALAGLLSLFALGIMRKVGRR